MRRSVLFIVFILSIPCTVNFSCSKDEEIKDTDKPTITISSPAPNQSIVLNGDSIHVMINVSDDVLLHSFTAELKTVSGDTWFNEAPNVQDIKFYTYHKHYNPVNLSVNTPLVLTTTAVDKTGKT